MNMCAVISVVLLIMGLSYTSAASTLLDKIKEDPDLSQVSHTYSNNNNSNNRSFNLNRVHFVNSLLDHVCYVYQFISTFQFFFYIGDKFASLFNNIVFKICNFQSLNHDVSWCVLWSSTVWPISKLHMRFTYLCNLVNTKKVSTADVTLWNGQMKNVNSRTNCENSEQTSIFFGMDNSIYENWSLYLNTVAMKSNQKKK